MTLKEIDSQDYKYHFIKKMYEPHKQEIYNAKFGADDETYGELLYYSAVKILNHLTIYENDVFLDIGSGFGNIIFTYYLQNIFSSFIGIEINFDRYKISKECLKKLSTIYTDAGFKIQFNHADILKYNLKDLDKVSIIYVCSTVFSEKLIFDIGELINKLVNTRYLISFRKIPNLTKLKLYKRIFVQASYDRAVCYIYKVTVK